MIQIDVRNNLPEFKSVMLLHGKQATFAMAVALTRTMQEIKRAEVTEMQQVFDAPTRYTLNSLYMKSATKEDLAARVWFKDSARPNHYLLPEVHGGARPLKRFEEMLVRKGYMDSTERAVPGAGAVLDTFGNMSRGQVVKILSQLNSFYLAGSDANATTSRRSRAKRADVEYFLSRGPQRPSVGRGSWKAGNKVQHLPRGVYVRRKFAKGSSIKPVLLFVKGTSYRPLFKFFGVAEGIGNSRMPFHFRNEFDKAMRTAFFTKQGGLF